jgi:hypothetical protein
MAIPLIGGLIAAVAPAIKDVVMDVVKDVAMDVGKSFVDTIGKGVKDFASDMIGKGGKIVGDLIKNPLDALKDIAKKFMPPQFQQLLNMGKTVMQAATSILNKFMEKANININININFGGAQAAQGGGVAASGPHIMGHEQAAEHLLNHQHGSLEVPASMADMLHGPRPQILPSSSNNTSGVGNTSSAGSSGKTESAGGTGDAGKTDEAKEYTDVNAKKFAAGEMNGAQLERLQLSDPKAFQSMMKGMSTEDRGLAMQQMQTHLQSVNQMLSMMTNMAQIQHDSAKAIINNMRV